ncbi:MAG TPA: carboxypeptidase regulatory-like domain-containing protein [Bryobacteraceae bacterium]|nr:carboxypeptidase regulatory-like domain-containing protein [Bryobacteraceae bacterium]
MRRCAQVGLLLLVPALVFGQATGTINGTVFDSTGAVVPGVPVTVVNTGTNQTRNVVADESGRYVAPLLPVGNYNVRVEKPGFAPFLQTGVILQVNTNIQVNATLTPRAANDQVTVSSDAVMVQATTSNLVQVVDARRIEDLPLNGRNILQLMSLSAGVSDRGAAGGTLQINTIGGGQYHAPVSINGARGNATNFLLDNADNNDGYTNIAEPYPNPDAIQEFSIQTSTFDAQYGRQVGGVVNAVTRSGTNQFHGTAFDFLRNYKMNAANFFSGRDALKRNQYGGTIGGPVTIPNVYNGKDKTFFFFSYQGTKQRVASPGALRSAPSEAMKGGDFSSWLTADGRGAIRDPKGNGYLPGNIIPQSLIDPTARGLLNYIPSTADPAYQLRLNTPVNPTDDVQYIGKLDQIISAKQRISGRVFYLFYDRPWVSIPNNLLYVNTGQFGGSTSITMNHSYTFTPRMLNDFTATFHQTTPTSQPSPELDISFEKLGSRMRAVPGFATMDVGISNWSGVSLGLGYYAPQATYQVGNTLSYATGKHNLRVGGEVKRYRLDIASYWLSGGSATFNGQMLSDPGRSNAGNAFAEFMLGVGSAWRQQSFWSSRIYNWSTGLFFQDDIRVTQKLTVNVGMRWDPRYDIKEKYMKRMTFVPGRQSVTYPNAPPGLLFQRDPGFENGIIPTQWKLFAPRFGFAYQLRPKTVIRSAYGIFYDTYMSIFNNRTAAGQPFVQQSLLNGPFQLSDPYAGGAILNPSPVVPGKEFQFTPYGTWGLQSPDLKVGYMQNWNFVIEQQLPGDWLVRAAYVGSKGSRLLNSPEINPGIYGPGATAANINQRRPYQPIGGLQLATGSAWSKYHSAQFTIQKRFSHGFSVLANYTISKSIDISSYATAEGNSTGPDPFNFNNNRGPSDFDIPQRLVVSGIVEHPKLAGMHPALRTALGGWQSNFIFTAQEGTPFTVLSGVDNALTGVGGNRADLTGAPIDLGSGRSRADEINAWFNPAAFRQNAIGTVGQIGRNRLRVPGGWNADYSIFKEFSLVERARLQLRGEMFNVFNHTRLGGPTATVTSPLFGRITSALDPRIIQVAAKFVF